MVANSTSVPSLSFEEETALARANLERDIGKVQAERDWLLAQGRDLEAEGDAWVRAHFTAEALLHAWREHLAERGKSLADDLAEPGANSTEAATDARSTR